MKLGLQSRYALAILPLIALLVGLSAALLLYHINQQADDMRKSSANVLGTSLFKKMENNGRALALLLAENLINDVYLMDLVDIGDTIGPTRDRRDVDYVYVFDTSGRVLHDGTDENVAFGRVLGDSHVRLALGSAEPVVWIDNTLNVATAIRLGPEVLGGVSVGLSLEPVHRDLTTLKGELDALRQGHVEVYVVWSVAAALALLVIGTLVTILLARNLSRPITTLAKLTSRIGQGNYYVDIPVERSDEIGTLADSLRKMVDDLRHTTVSKAYVDNILATTLDALIVVAPDGAIRTVNPAACKLLGYDVDELIGQPVANIIAEEGIGNGASAESDAIEPILAGDVESALLAKDGREIPVLISGARMQDADGNLEGVVYAARDITARKKAEREIAEKSALINTTFENMTRGFAIYDADFKIAAFNQRYVELMDHPAELIRIGQSAETLIRFKAERGDYGPGDIDKIVERHMAARRRGEKGWREQSNPDGTVIAVRRDPMPDGGYVATYTDITERKKAEREIAEKSALLETTFESMSQAISVFDADLRLVAYNQRYLDLRDYPKDYISLGMPYEEVVRFNAERGEYGPGDSDKQVKERLGAARSGKPWRTEYTKADGTALAVGFDPIPGGGFVSTFVDMTERKKAEQEIAEKSTLLETTFETMSQGLIVYDADFKLAAFNQNFVEFRDYPADFIRLGMPLAEVIRFNAKRGDYGPCDPDIQAKECRARRTKKAEYERPGPNGKLIAFPREPMPGGGTVTTLTDITELKKAEQEIAEKSALLETTFENMSQGFATYDADLRLTAFNQRYLDLRGYPPGFIHLGMPFEEIARFRAKRGDYGPGDVEGLVKEAMKRARQRTVEVREYTAPDGIVTSVLHDPMPGGGYVITITDITERKQAEREIAEKSALLETTFESMSQGMTVYDADLKLIGFNQTYIEILGYPADFIRIGMPFEEIARFRAEQGAYGPGDPEKLAAQSMKAASQGKAMHHEFTRPDGAVFAIRRDPLPDGGFVTTLTDITERKKAEEEIAEKSALLETTFENIAHGFAVYDEDDRLIAFNQKYVDLCDYPPDFVRLGMPFEEFSRFRAERGYYGPGDAGEQVRERVESRRKGETAQRERVMPDGRVVLVRRELMPGGGYVSTFTDITELRKAEQEIAEKSALVETTLESMSQGITVYDGNHRLIAFNPRFVELFEFPADYLRPGRTFEDLARFLAERGEYGPGDVEELVRKRVEARDLGGINPRERTRPNGTVILARRDPMPGGGYVTTYTDITERKRAEAALRESEELFSRVFHASPGMIAISRPEDGAHHEVSENWIATMGYSRDEAMAKTAVELGIWADTRERARFVKRLKKKGSVRDFETKFRTKSGEELDVLVAGEYIEIGGEPHLIVVSHDITARKRAEEAVRESQRRFAGIVELADDAIISIDDERHITLFNEGAERTFGYEAKEVLGQPIEMLLPASARKEHRRHVNNFAKNPDASRVMGEQRGLLGRRKDGTEFPAEISISKLETEGKHVFTAILRDITERKRAEEALQARQARLRELQTELLNVSRQSAMGELSSALAHELNQPLAAIMNYVQASRRMIKKGGGTASEKAYQMMDNAIDQADRAGAIMRGLRDIVEKGETARGESDINKVVEEASALGLIGAARKGIVVDLEFGANLPTVIINEIQIQQVVMNLVRNGVEAMAASKKRDLTIKTALDGENMVEIAIENTGPGLAKEVEERLFQPFVSTKAGGMGIGLSISHSIVEAHGGRLWATPNPDGGTVFHFTLPLAPNGAQDDDE
jgi:PAS domain S-box-containing protein